MPGWASAEASVSDTLEKAVKCREFSGGLQRSHSAEHADARYQIGKRRCLRLILGRYRLMIGRLDLAIQERLF